MSGINSIVGLNKVDLDYRPEIKNPTGKNGADKVQDGANDNIINANVNVEPAQEEIPPKKGECRSVMQQLDVLLLNATHSLRTSSPSGGKPSDEGEADRRTIILQQIDANMV